MHTRRPAEEEKSLSWGQPRATFDEFLSKQAQSARPLGRGYESVERWNAVICIPRRAEARVRPRRPPRPRTGPAWSEEEAPEWPPRAARTNRIFDGHKEGTPARARRGMGGASRNVGQPTCTHLVVFPSLPPVLLHHLFPPRAPSAPLSPAGGCLLSIPLVPHLTPIRAR